MESCNSKYKRLVSYIYSYPGGCRDRNVGFAKAEVRNGMFTLNVTLCGVYRDAPEGFGIYLLFDRTREQQTYNMLPVGSVIVNCGKGKFQGIFNPGNIESSGYQFDEIKGIGVLTEKDNYYMCFSLWEADTINPSKCVYLPKGYKRDESKFNMNECGQQTDKHTYTRHIDEPKKHDNILMAAEASEPTSDASSIKIMSGSAIKDEPNGRIENSEPLEKLNRSEYEQSGKSNNLEYEPPAKSNESEYEQVEKSNKSKCEQLEQLNGSESELSEKLNKKDMSDNVGICDNNKNIGVGNKGSIDVERLFIHADYVNAFDDDYYYDCIEGTPEMLKRFMGNDVIGNNSFLMHSYYTYRHLLFGRVADNDNGTKYFIGVPGMYSNKERYLATMFGFNNFKKSHRSDYPNPYFGYWYTEI